jgi:hypothetical protein
MSESAFEQKESSNPLFNPDFQTDSAQEVDPEDPRMGLPASVEVSENNAPMDLAQPNPEAEGPWIAYNGVGTVRIMDEQAWKAAGVESTKYVEWNYLNKKRIPVSEFNDKELQYLLRVDGRFSVQEAEPETKEDSDI